MCSERRLRGDAVRLVERIDDEIRLRTIGCDGWKELDVGRGHAVEDTRNAFVHGVAWLGVSLTRFARFVGRAGLVLLGVRLTQRA